MYHMYDFDLKNLFVSSFAIINKSEDFMVSYCITRNKSNYTTAKLPTIARCVTSNSATCRSQRWKKSCLIPISVLGRNNFRI